MKNILSFCFFLLSASFAFSQSLEGVWQGHFDYEDWSHYPKTNLALRIIKLNDSSYNIHSYTRIRMQNNTDSVIVCRVNYAKIGDNTFKLQEQEFINANFASNVLQTMFLKLKVKKGKSLLTGYWESMDPFASAETTRGRITFTRQ